MSYPVPSREAKRAGSDERWREAGSCSSQGAAAPSVQRPTSEDLQAAMTDADRLTCSSCLADPAATLGFCKSYQAMEPVRTVDSTAALPHPDSLAMIGVAQAPKGTIRIFDRADFYSCYGHDALFVAKEVYRTHTVISPSRRSSSTEAQALIGRVSPDRMDRPTQFRL